MYKSIRFPAFILVIILLAAILAACTTPEVTTGTTGAATTATSATTTAKTSRELITLNWYAGNTNASPGLQENMYWTKILEEDLGIKLNVISGTDEIINAYIASGDLPDMGLIYKSDDFQNAYNADLLVNFDDYIDLIPSVLVNYPAGSLQFQRDRYADGGLHSLPSGAQTVFKTYGGSEYYMRVDFPYYLEYVEANGEPELKDYEDFLPILKSIQDAHPTNDDGQAAYGMSIFAEWDGSTVGYGDWISEQYGVIYKDFAEIDMDSLTYQSIFDDDSVYKRTLKLLYDANQLGILDPDSMTQTWNDYMAKVDARRIYSTYCFYANDFTRCLPYVNLNTVDYTGPAYLGNGSGSWGFYISANSDYVERCCEFFNYVINEDNWWRLKFGNQGEFWDINSDGQVYVTEKGQNMEKDSTVLFEDGGSLILNSAICNWNTRFIDWCVVNKTYGANYSTASWPTRDVSMKTDNQKIWVTYISDK
ncbi:MAG TPA: hypothetical protein DD640_01715, partial [Clostridiales bacterium]|nr:hypothetical protein [Clostridiales bacterium]